MPVTSRRSAFRLAFSQGAPLAALALAALLPAAQALAQAAVWPTKPVRIVVTFPPGGAPDTLARVLADKWGQTLGQTITVDNKPGAGGNIGADFVAKSPGDGTTLIIGTVGTHAINAALYAICRSTMSRTSPRSPSWRPRPTCWWSTTRWLPPMSRS
jgi:tripartite-type tricarboxylate transporter receptor subunit TctC